MFKSFNVLLCATALLALSVLGFQAVANNTTPLNTILEPDSVFYVNQPVQVEGVEINPFIVSTAAPGIDLGRLLETALPGLNHLEIEVIDQFGEVRQEIVSYWVVYRTRLMEPMLLGEADANGNNLFLEAQLGDVIPFAVSVTDFHDRPAPWSSGSVSLLDSNSNQVIPIGDDIVGVFKFDIETNLYRYTLETAGLSPDTYDLILQFNSSFTKYQFTLELTN